MSALPPKADMSTIKTNVRFVPKADMGWGESEHCAHSIRAEVFANLTVRGQPVRVPVDLSDAN
jgi:hypothetical protein